MRPQTPPRTAGRLATLVVAAAATAGLTGCFAEATVGGLSAGALYLVQHPESMPLEDWSDVHKRREPRASLTQYRHDIGFAAGEAGLPAAEGQRLDAFIARMDVGRSDRVYLLTGAPAGVDAVEARQLGQRRIDTLVTFLALHDITPSPLYSDFGVQQPEGDRISIVVRRYVVTLPACPDWTGQPGNNFNNQVISNFGCATATNLGMMVADPADLVIGQQPGLSDGEAVARSMERYRKGETTPISPEDVSKTQSAQKSQSGGSGAEN